MASYVNVLVASGAVALLYVMFKFFISKEEETSKKAPDSEEYSEVKKELFPSEHPRILDNSQLKHMLDDPTIEANGRVMKRLRYKPNFFVAIQVNDITIHQNVKKIQEKVLAKNPLLYPAIVNVSTLHVTLAVTNLASDKDIKTLKDKLDKWSEKYIDSFSGTPIILSFTGVNCFKNSVAYVDLDPDESYKRLMDVNTQISHLISSAGFNTESKPFVPHLTFLKLSKSVMLQKLKKTFVEDFKELKECKECFGKQEVTHVQLLSMDEPKDKFGYYKCYHQIKISDSKQDMDHSECCAPIPKPVLSKIS